MSRKATEVLLSIEHTVKKILAHTQNTDMLLKNMSNKIALLEKHQKEQPQGLSPQERPFVNKNVVAGPDPRTFKVPDQKVNKTMPGLKPGIELNANNQLVKKTESKPSLVNVQQSVEYGGKIVASAQIEIFQPNPNNPSDLQFVRKLRTNASGKWTSQLPPGQYFVQASKKGANDKHISGEDMIIIPPSNDNIQLDMLMLN